MWNIENPLYFLKQTREEYYTDDWMLTVKPIYYTTKHISFNEIYSRLFYYWKLIAEIKIINNTWTSFRWNMKWLLDKLQVNYLSYKIDIKQTINSIYLIPKEIIIEENILAGISFKELSFKDITVVKFLESSFKVIGFLKWNFKWKKNIKIKVPYLITEDKKETYYFINEKFEKVVEQEYKEIEKNYFLSNKNLKEWFFIFKTENYLIESLKDYFFHSIPFQNLFSFFEKELDKKWIKNYEIFLWNYENSFNSNNYSLLYYVLIQLQIFVNGVFDEKLTEGLMEIYSQTWWNISRRFLWNVNGENVYWKYISFLVDKFSPIFTFDKEFSENILHSFVDLWHGYFYLDSFSRNDSQLWRNNIYKYSYEENKFIPLEKSSQTQQILEKSSIKNWFCYINSNFDLKVFIDWDKEYSINLVKALKIKDTSNLNSESFKHLLLEDNWKEVFLSYRWKIIYLSFKEWVWFNKIYQFAKEYDINQDITFGSEQTYFYENWNSFMVNVLGLSIFIPINNLLNFDPSKVLLKKIIINDIYVEDSGSPSGIYDWYRFMYGLKWYFFIKKYNFEFKKEKKEEEKESNLFSRWVYKNIWGKIMLMRNNSYASVTTSQNSSIEKLCKNIVGKKMFGLSNWKIWFYE